MKHLEQLICAVALALPLVAIAQSSPHVLPANQPRTALEAEQKTENGQATKYGGPGTDISKPGEDTSATTTPRSKSSKMGRKHRAMKKSNDSGTVGDIPTYPAPKADGTPTSPQTTK